jgi:dihydropteroate synthase
MTRPDPAPSAEPGERRLATEPGERRLPAERGVVPGRPEGGGGRATPSFADLGGSSQGPAAAGHGQAAGRTDPTSRPGPTVIGGRTFTWGERTHVMGIVNVTPDSFSGDGLLATPPVSGADSPAGGVADGRADGRPDDPATVVDRAVALARRMVAEGADLVDVGGESTRPGHNEVDAAEETRRVVPVVAAIHEALPDLPISVDTTKPSVAAAALAAGAAMLNDVWGVAPDDGLIRLAAERGVPITIMHNRSEARYRNVVVEVLADLERAVERALAAGVGIEAIVVDPGFGFGKAPRHNLELLAGLSHLRLLGRPILLGTSRKSTLGRVLDLPPEDRLEATLATTALAVQAGVDIVRVHDVRPNVRVARMADAIVRGRWPAEFRAAASDSSASRPSVRLRGGDR